jgi:D-glycero-alpha-D-manno-heptose-7-phosphate kinase
MIITKTPFRVSFVGGGSDLEEYYSQRTGAVLSTTINKYMYISSHNFFDDESIRIKYSQTETVKDINNLQHPIAKEVLKKFNINGALEVSSSGDVPSGTGLGSSSSFTVGLLHNLYTRSGKHATKEQLSEEACEIEIEKLGEPIGKQDQYAAAFGGINIFKFNPDGTVNVEQIHLKKEVNKRLQNNLLMFYTGQQRSASEILKQQKKVTGQSDKSKILEEMVGLVCKMRDALYNDELTLFGTILHENWLLKKQITNKISGTFIDEIYERGLKNGAVGGKLLGAGGGGFMLFYCEEENQAKLRKELRDLKEMHFKFDNEGSKVIYVGDEYN